VGTSFMFVDNQTWCYICFVATREFWPDTFLVIDRGYSMYVLKMYEAL
jgi:hypothetical protein